MTDEVVATFAAVKKFTDSWLFRLTSRSMMFVSVAGLGWIVSQYNAQADISRSLSDRVVVLEREIGTVQDTQAERAEVSDARATEDAQYKRELTNKIDTLTSTIVKLQIDFSGLNATLRAINGQAPARLASP